MEMVSFQELKRKDSEREEDSVSFKKARYEWQIKRSLDNQESDKDVPLGTDDNKTGATCNISLNEATEFKGENDLINTLTCANNNTHNNSFSWRNANSDTVCAQVPECSSSSHQEFSRNSVGISCDPVNAQSTCTSLHVQLPKWTDTSTVKQNATDAHSAASSTECNLSKSESDCSLSNRAIPLPNRPNQLDTYLAKRQNHHIAKAVVDNAINKTLEEMGVSPDSDPNGFTAEKSHIEDEGICEAIRSQGLVPQHQTSEQGINYSDMPFMLQQASELVFSRQQSSAVLAHGRNPTEGLQTPTIRQDHCVNPSYCTPVSNADLLDQAVSMVICSRGLTLQEEG